MRTRLILSLTILMFLLLSRSPYCWEADTHYGLVKWLAVKAGFDLDNAEIIAAGSESADESNALSASFLVLTYVCFERSSEASRHVQQHHFPSDGSVPSPREKRQVSPGDPNTNNSGNRWVRQEIAIPGNSSFPRTNLNRFGQSLHALADSWSHQGKPGNSVIPVCLDDLVWAHSDNRGGWSSHDADLTYKYVEDAVSTAKAIYSYNTEFLQRNKEFLARPQIPWSKLESRVRTFAEADTAQKKKKWFNENTDVPLESYTTYPCFLGKITLEGHDEICEEKFAATQSQGRQSAGLDLTTKQATKEAAEFFEYFLTTWIVKGTVDELVEENMNIDSVVRGVIAEKLQQPPVRWVRTILLMWLVPDHGLVNKLGHGMPGKEGFNTLAEIIGKQRIKFQSLSEAIHYPGTSQPYLITSIPPRTYGQNSFAATFQFRHTPRDMLTLIASQELGKWRIVGLTWLAL